MYSYNLNFISQHNYNYSNVLRAFTDHHLHFLAQLQTDTDFDHAIYSIFEFCVKNLLNQLFTIHLL